MWNYNPTYSNYMIASNSSTFMLVISIIMIIITITPLALVSLSLMESKQKNDWFSVLSLYYNFFHLPCRTTILEKIFKLIHFSCGVHDLFSIFRIRALVVLLLSILCTNSVDSIAFHFRLERIDGIITKISNDTVKC